MICWTWVISFLPNFPAGCELAKSFFVKPLDSKSAIANASPKARAEVVDDVGARSSGHASLLIFKMILISEDLDIVEFFLPVKDAILYESLLSDGIMLMISSVSPEFDINKTISFFSIRPISPCAASVGCIKIDPVPVLESVADIFWPI